MEDKNEPLLMDVENCYVWNTKLNEYQDVHECYKRQLSSFWTPVEIDFSQDRARFLKMNKDEQHFYSTVLAFFACADGLVSENLSENFIQDCKIPIIQNTYAFQNAMEFIHAETYTLLLDSIVPDGEEKQKLFNAIENIPAIAKKIAFGKRYIECGCPFRYRLTAFIIFEGIFFSGSFASIFYNKNKSGDKQLSGLITANEFIARDEGEHCKFGCLLYSKLKKKLSQKEIYQMFSNALQIEIEFINESLPCSLLGMNKNKMREYIEFISDFWLLQLGYKKMYNTANPFEWMESISIESKTNFFEQRVTQYSKAEGHGEFCMTDDF